MYKESGGDTEKIPWADMEPNRFFKAWAEETELKGGGRSALVVGCGLGDDAKYLHDLGFKVTAFDISPTAIEWAKKVYGDTDIQFETADLFQAPQSWVRQTTAPATAETSSPPRQPLKSSGCHPSLNKEGNSEHGFDFVLEIYTIQPLPIEMRPQTIDAVASFVAPEGMLVVVCRGREDDEEVDEVPWPLSRKDLSRFEHNGLRQVSFEIMPDETDDLPAPRFVVKYVR